MKGSHARWRKIGRLVIDCASTRLLTVTLFLVTFCAAATCATLAIADDRLAPQRAPVATATDPAADPGAEPPPGEPLTHTVLAELIRQRRFEEAVRRVNQAMAAAPQDRDAHAMYLLLIGTIGAEIPETDLANLRQVVESALAAPTLDTAIAIGAANAVQRLVTGDPQLSPDDKLDLLERLDQKLPDDEKHLAAVKADILRHRVSTLIVAGRDDKARAALNKMVDSQRTKADPADSQSVRRFVDAVATYQLIGGKLFAERAEELVEEAETLTAAAMAQDEVDMTAVIAFFGLRQTRISSLAKSDPKAALAVIEETEQALSSAYKRLHRASIPALSTYTRTLASLRLEIERNLKIAALPGAEAPEIDAEFFVGRNPVTMQGLKGKVVLIHFWSVWCDPCIDTFPQLIQWHENYADRGLIILGATRYYGYRWDKEAHRPVKASNVSHEDERAMLERFRTSHNLRHGFFVTPNNSQYQAALTVRGIPHAVLIDRDGKIYVSRGRWSDAIAKELQEQIEQLLAAEL